MFSPNNSREIIQINIGTVCFLHVLPDHIFETVCLFKDKQPENGDWNIRFYLNMICVIHFALRQVKIIKKKQTAEGNVNDLLILFCKFVCLYFYDLDFCEQKKIAHDAIFVFTYFRFLMTECIDYWRYFHIFLI